MVVGTGSGQTRTPRMRLDVGVGPTPTVPGATVHSGPGSAGRSVGRRLPGTRSAAPARTGSATRGSCPG